MDTNSTISQNFETLNSLLNNMTEHVNAYLESRKNKPLVHKHEIEELQRLITELHTQYERLNISELKNKLNELTRAIQG